MSSWSFQLDNFVQHLKPSTVDEQIFPHVALGFGDTIPAMREQTVKVNAIFSPLKDSFLAWRVTFDLPKEVGEY